MARKKSTSVLFQKPIEVPENVAQIENKTVETEELLSTKVSYNESSDNKSEYILTLEQTNVLLNKEISKLTEQLEIYILENEELQIQLSKNTVQAPTNNTEELIKQINNLKLENSRLKLMNDKLLKNNFNNGYKHSIIQGGYTDWN